MSDSQDAWPPPSISQEPIPPPPDKQKMGIASLRCLLASIILSIVCIALVMGSGFWAMAGVWVMGELVLTYAGIQLGIRGLRSWQGKCGLCGSILMGVFDFLVIKLLVGMNVS